MSLTASPLRELLLAGWLPERASSVAEGVDLVFGFIFWLSAFFLALIVGLTVLFVVRYRRTAARRAPEASPDHSTRLEVFWSAIPLLLVVVGGDGRVSGYLHGISYPAPALDEALGRAARNQVATLAQQQGLGGFLLSCMGYDPADRSPLALQVMRGGGVVVLLFLASLLASLALRGAWRRRLHGRTP